MGIWCGPSWVQFPRRSPGEVLAEKTSLPLVASASLSRRSAQPFEVLDPPFPLPTQMQRSRPPA
eukprot:365628-Chlamydomonas_euryale.AAC.6